MQGQEEGIKDRPAAVLFSVVEKDGQKVVVVLPITHSAPQAEIHAIEIPRATKHRLGLDQRQSWVVLTEANRFYWPGFDVRPEKSGDPSSLAYGELPAVLYERIREKWLELFEKRQTRILARTR